jgi:hypothetical protein
MENISVFGQSFLLLAGGIVLLGLCMGIVFYSWSLQLFKKLDFQIKQMKQNIESLESLSQFVYETSYRDIKKMASKDKQNIKNSNNFMTEQPILEAIKNDIENLIQKQTEISKTLEQKTSEKPISQDDYLSLNTGSVQFLSEEEKTKYQQISKLILKHLQDLLKEKEQVTAQELVYAMPDHYSLADIYRTLELMKEKKQINWSDRNISPQSFLELSQ